MQIELKFKDFEILLWKKKRFRLCRNSIPGLSMPVTLIILALRFIFLEMGRKNDLAILKKCKKCIV